MFVMSATTWNNLQNIIPIDMLTENYSIVRKGVTNYFFNQLELLVIQVLLYRVFQKKL